MADDVSREHTTIDELRRIRDEISLKIHLARADARDEWERAEDKWNRLQGHLKVLRDETAESMDGISEAAKTLAAEIGSAYSRIRKLL
jgi:vacuolar-type H+-ATPase subunit H